MASQSPREDVVFQQLACTNSGLDALEKRIKPLIAKYESIHQRASDGKIDSEEASRILSRAEDDIFGLLEEYRVLTDSFTEVCDTFIENASRFRREGDPPLYTMAVVQEAGHSVIARATKLFDQFDGLPVFY